MVTKKIKKHVGTIIQYDRDTKKTTEVKGQVIGIVRGTTTSFIKRYEQVNNVKVVDIIDIKEEVAVYSMTDSDFIKYATKAGQEKDETADKPKGGKKK